MEYENFFNWLEMAYRIEINKELQNTLEEQFGADLNIYTEQDLYEHSRKIIQTYKDKYINQNYYKYRKYFQKIKININEQTITKQSNLAKVHLVFDFF